MDALVVALLAWIKLLGGYPIPEHLPEVHLVPHASIEALACNAPCPVVGWFPPGDRIYLDDRLDPDGDVRARGILLHELVHYVQQQSGRFEGMEACAASLAREREAYGIQNRWLVAQGVMPGQAAPLHLAPCRPERAAGPTTAP